MTELIRAIYVEDEPALRDWLGWALELAEIRVTMVCRSAEEFIEKMGTTEYEEAEVFIFDIRLPGITGLELAAELRQRGEERPIVALSAWPRRQEEDLEAIDVAFLRKPFEFMELKDLIEKLVGDRTTLKDS
jgi:two-component system response regulator YesN